MKIIYRPHAVDRMQERNISTVEIEAILNTPDGKLKQSKDKFIFYKKLKGRSDNMLAAVSVVKNINFYEIITVMINFEVKK